VYPRVPKSSPKGHSESGLECPGVDSLGQVWDWSPRVGADGSARRFAVMWNEVERWRPERGRRITHSPPHYSNPGRKGPKPGAPCGRKSLVSPRRAWRSAVGLGLWGGEGQCPALADFANTELQLARGACSLRLDASEQQRSLRVRLIAQPLGSPSGRWVSIFFVLRPFQTEPSRPPLSLPLLHPPPRISPSIWGAVRD
jgi:hypothetical protein